MSNELSVLTATPASIAFYLQYLFWDYEKLISVDRIIISQGL